MRIYVMPMLAENIHQFLWAEADEFYRRHDDPSDAYELSWITVDYNPAAEPVLRFLAMKQAMRRRCLPLSDEYCSLYSNVCCHPAEWLAGRM